MKTAEELGLSQEEFNALLQVRAMLDSTPTEQKKVIAADKETREYLAGYAKDNDEEAVKERLAWDEELNNVLDGFGGFNMQYQARTESKDGSRYFDCGTTACIGGWMGIFMWDKAPVIGQKHVMQPGNAKRVQDFVNDFDPGRSYATRKFTSEDSYELSPMSKLFYPRIDILWSRITPQHAVKAIDSVLETGDVNWYDIVYPQVGFAVQPPITAEEA